MHPPPTTTTQIRHKQSYQVVQELLGEQMELWYQRC